MVSWRSPAPPLVISTSWDYFVLVIYRWATRDHHIDINLKDLTVYQLTMTSIPIEDWVDNGIQHSQGSLTATPLRRTPAILEDTPNTQLERLEDEIPTIQNINQSLAKRRRKSYPKACYPCRCRKIRCDHLNPCGNCLKHEQPKLCVYLDQNGQVRKQQATAPSKPSNASTKDRVAALTDLERRMQTIAEEVVKRLGSLGGRILQEPAKQPQTHEVSAIEMRSPLQTPESHASPATVGEDGVGASVHIGAESLASILVDALKSAHPVAASAQSTDDIKSSRHSAYETMQLLYMTDTGSTHPFTSLWKPGATVEDVCLALPDNETFELYVASAVLKYTLTQQTLS